MEIAISDIEVNPRQPRTHFSPSHLEDLIASIKEYGIIQPLVVTQSNDGYQLIAGERRLRASKALGLETVPVVIRTATDQEKLVLALIENIQRHDLNPVEEARSFKALMDQFSLTQDDAAKRVGKSRSSIANTIRLLDLNDEMLDALQEGEITRSHARALLAQTDQMLRNQMFLQMLSGDMTVREAEQLSTTKKAPAIKPAKDANLEAQERSLETIFGTKVRIEPKSKGKGQIVLEYYSDEEYYTILDLMGTIAI
jgi:ParB family chromosome partitioning protein